MTTLIYVASGVVGFIAVGFLIAAYVGVGSDHDRD